MNKETFYRHVNDLFVTFSSQTHVETFFDHLNSHHNNMSFTKEDEIGDKLPFLHSTYQEKITHTSIYRKPTFSGDNIFERFIMTHFKQGLFLSLLL